MSGGHNKKFKRRAKKIYPRYSPVLAIGWVIAVFCGLLSFVRGINGTDPQFWSWHYIADGAVWTALLVCISFLWEAWEREERFPELLPKREFERRYPPSSAAPPAPSRPPNNLLPLHRRVPYIEEITPTGNPYIFEPRRADPDIIVPRWDSREQNPEKARQHFREQEVPRAEDDR